MAKTPMGIESMPRSVHFSFSEKSQTPKGFNDLTMGQEVTLIVKGKVSSLNSDQYGCGFSLEGFTVKIDKGGLRRPMR